MVFMHNVGVLDLQKCGKNVELSSILAFFGVMVRNGSGSTKKLIFLLILDSQEGSNIE